MIHMFSSFARFLNLRAASPIACSLLKLVLLEFTLRICK
ncbi:Uncharacterised protein [Segatella copri]|nr:Uncharacterised protein [Segatella copri]